MGIQVTHLLSGLRNTLPSFTQACTTFFLGVEREAGKLLFLGRSDKRLFILRLLRPRGWIKEKLTARGGHASCDTPRIVVRPSCRGRGSETLLATTIEGVMVTNSNTETGSWVGGFFIFSDWGWGGVLVHGAGQLMIGISGKRREEKNVLLGSHLTQTRDTRGTSGPSPPSEFSLGRF